jgi:tetratricopeptide (TPR) repeat protein
VYKRISEAQPMMMTSSVHINPASFGDLLKNAACDPVLRGLGAPSQESISIFLSREPALLALHLAATFYRAAVVFEVLDSYSAQACPVVEEFQARAVLIAALRGKAPRAVAATLYHYAGKLAPELAEARYGLARLAQAASEMTQALASFKEVLRLSPHPRSPSHVALHGNAYWECATIFEQQGHDQAALEAYRSATSRLESFGVHHIRVARFLKRLGHLEEAAGHYRRCMTYTHRYMPEFTPPLLSDDAPTPAALVSLDAIYTTQKGECVVFLNGQYVAFDAREWPLDTAGLQRRLSEGLPHRTATSITSLEEVDSSPP